MEKRVYTTPETDVVRIDAALMFATSNNGLEDPSHGGSWTW